MSTAALVALALGATFGRWRVLPVTERGEGVRVRADSAVLLVPVSPLELRDGDTIFVKSTRDDRGSFLNVEGLQDSWDRRFSVTGDDGDPIDVELPATVWRVSREVPYAGMPYRLLIGPVQGILLVLNGVLLIAFTQLRRPTERPPAPSQRPRRWIRPRGPRERPAVAAVAAVATPGLVLSLV